MFISFGLLSLYYEKKGPVTFGYETGWSLRGGNSVTKREIFS